jgi:hypothetical protein
MTNTMNDVSTAVVLTVIVLFIYLLIVGVRILIYRAKRKKADRFEPYAGKTLGL